MALAPLSLSKSDASIEERTSNSLFSPMVPIAAPTHSFCVHLPAAAHIPPYLIILPDNNKEGGKQVVFKADRAR